MKIEPGVETLTVTGAAPGSRLRLTRVDGNPVVTVVTDEKGNAHIAFIPARHTTIESFEDMLRVLADGQTLPPGEYTIIDEATGDQYQTRVMAIEDLPDESLYAQELTEGFGYLTVRDGVKLSIMVRFPNQDLHGPPPWPTVVEYSGYGPSNPDAAQPGTLIANMLGFACVGVNMRGTGCSGGVFDIFSPAQAADGYDVIETVARQSWVLHNHVGMVGLSYPGNSQLFVGATRPPSLAAITPLSVLDDLWRQQWPGGIYNSGFTRAWLAQRDVETKMGGMAWDLARIESGDKTCAENQSIRTMNIEFAEFGKAMENFQPAMSTRRAANFVEKIEVPVYLTGSWQDEQTGSRFALMLNEFKSSPHAIFTLFNGHHPDGYSPMVIARWYEFLSFYVAKRVPKLHPVIRQLAPAEFAKRFKYLAEFEEDRFGDLLDDYDAALERYKSEPPVRILFESGTATETPGAPGHRHEATTVAFPPPDVEARRWWFGPGASLLEEPSAEESADVYEDDLEAGGIRYAKVESFDAFIEPAVPFEWTYFADSHCVAYETVLNETLVIAGQGHVDLWIRPGTPDTAVQATLTEIRPDGHEVKVQCGWHRPVHGVEDSARSDELRVDYTFAPEDRRQLTPGAWYRTRIPFMPVAHVFRSGSRMRVTISTPGRDMPLWNFENPVKPGARHHIGRGGSRASALVLPVWPTELSHPEEYPAHNSLRGQPSRPARPIKNLEVDGLGG